jgi:hypothetical protein
MKWHYSKTMPQPPHIFFGAWESDKFVGVVIYSPGSRPNIGKPYGLEDNQAIELTRVALSPAHQVETSKIVAASIRQLKKVRPNLKLIVSYADPHQGHHGGIYQAMNWIYTGTTGRHCSYLAPDGKVWHSRYVSPTGLKKTFGEMRVVWRPDQCQRIELPGKHRYLMPLDSETRVSVQSLSVPYPKRPKQAESEPSELRQCNADPDAPIKSSLLYLESVTND